jgi:hypothetical protein
MGEWYRGARRQELVVAAWVDDAFGIFFDRKKEERTTS